MNKFSLQYRAHLAVQQAVKRGDLAHLSYHHNAGIACVDCGDVAECWEHRDYAHALDVEPVCSRCNWHRGPGMNKETVDFQQLMVRMKNRGWSIARIAAVLAKDDVNVSNAALYNLRLGNTIEPRYNLGAALVDLERRTRPRK